MLRQISKIFLFVVLLLINLVGCVTEPERPMIKKEIKETSIVAKKGEDSAPRKRLMILPFLDANPARPQAVRDAARVEFIKDLNKTNAVIVIDSKELKIDLTKTQVSGEYSLEEVAKAAKDLGVAAVLEAKIVELTVKRKADEVGVFRQLKTVFECQARVRITSARSGKELFNTLKTVTIEESNVRVAEAVESDRFFQKNPEILENLVKETFLDFTPAILSTVDKLSWEGRIAMIQGERIFLNVGRVSGLLPGDVLKVSDEGDEVYDPQTGNYIGKVPGRLKGTLEVVSYFGQDGSIAIIHSGSGFKESDKVELY